MVYLDKDKKNIQPAKGCPLRAYKIENRPPRLSDAGGRKRRSDLPDKMFFLYLYYKPEKQRPMKK